MIEPKRWYQLKESQPMINSTELLGVKDQIVFVDRIFENENLVIVKNNDSDIYYYTKLTNIKE